MNSSTGSRDAVAGCLGLFLGPVGLWYKGHWAAGFAWLAGSMLTMMLFDTLVDPLFSIVVITPILCVGSGLHATLADWRRE